ncbi:hypothetical protein [Actinoallomurus sp. NPDC050550]|uniref:hypothetical protein n=1 Tax=Actinoallomurus sp. NPDC050550 TaxID=3154937 RepID=UPI0033F10E0C
MTDDTPPVRVMVRALNALKKELQRHDVTSHVTSTGTSRAVLHVTGLDISITCRTNSEHHHTWWFWLGDKPITSADAVEAAAEQLLGRGSSCQRTITHQSPETDG